MRKIDRFDKYIEVKGLNDNRVTKDLGLSVGTLGKSRKEGRDLSDKNIEKALNFYTDLNRIWLLTGEGPMLTTDEVEIVKYTNVPTANEPSAYSVYLLPMSAMGGPLTGFAADGVTLLNCEKIVSPIGNVDFAITVYGESMSPKYSSGTRVLIKKINPNIFIDWGKPYVLDTSNGVIIKELRKSNKEGYIACYSINPDPKFAPFDIPLSEVYGIYRVLMSLSAE